MMSANASRRVSTRQRRVSAPHHHCATSHLTLISDFGPPAFSLENRGADTRVCGVETHLDAFRERSESAVSRHFHHLLCAGQVHAYSSRRGREERHIITARPPIAP